MKRRNKMFNMSRWLIDYERNEDEPKLSCFEIKDLPKLKYKDFSFNICPSIKKKPKNI
jgi:hypothetical protein